MRRREVSDTELGRVIKLKNSGASWLKIQLETRVPRRSAKRAYDDWERSQSKEELKAARVQVATEVFREHLDCIIQVAEVFVNNLPESIIFYETRDADKIINDIWMRDIPEEYEGIVPFRNKSEKEQGRISRKNRMLFQSLKDHTIEQARWQALEEWKGACNACFNTLEKLRSNAQEIVTSILSNQELKVRDEIKKSSAGEAAIEDMAKGVVEALWRGIRDGEPEKSHNLIRTKAAKEGSTQVLFGKSASITMIELMDNNLAKEVERICKWTTKNLYIEWKETLVDPLRNGFDTMKKAIEELDKMLNPLILRPMILRTRCELCPA